MSLLLQGKAWKDKEHNDCHLPGFTAEAQLIGSGKAMSIGLVVDD